MLVVILRVMKFGKHRSCVMKPIFYAKRLNRYTELREISKHEKLIHSVLIYSPTERAIHRALVSKSVSQQVAQKRENERR